jgi:hypothetical protein
VSTWELAETIGKMLIEDFGGRAWQNPWTKVSWKFREALFTSHKELGIIEWWQL